MGEISYQCTALCTLLARLRRRESFGCRYAEQLLSLEEQALLQDIWPARPTRQEVRRAARALWTWTTYVGHEADAKLGPSVAVRIDGRLLLAAVDRLCKGKG
jgi:hypothetical protein